MFPEESSKPMTIPSETNLSFHIVPYNLLRSLYGYLNDESVPDSTVLRRLSAISARRAHPYIARGRKPREQDKHHTISPGGDTNPPHS